MRRFVRALVAVLIVAVPPRGIGPGDPGGLFADDDDSVHEEAIEAIGRGIVRWRLLRHDQPTASAP